MADEFETLLAQYEHNSQAVVDQRHELGVLEAGLTDFVTAGANALLGGDNPKTGKPHSWSSAEKHMKEHPDYRERQLDILKVRAEMERSEASCRALWLRLRMMIATREGVVAEVAA